MGFFCVVTRKLKLLHLRLKCRCYKTVLEYVCTYKFFPYQFLLFFKIRKEKKMNVLNIIGKKRNIPPKEHMENILCLEMTWLLVFLEEMQKKKQGECNIPSCCYGHVFLKMVRDNIICLKPSISFIVSRLICLFPGSLTAEFSNPQWVRYNIICLKPSISFTYWLFLVLFVCFQGV